MAATGKKGKKAKWNKVSMDVILAEPTAIPTSNNWADGADEEPENFGYGTTHRAPIVLPSASRAACGGMAVDEDAIPRHPPYVAHISNLPYDVDESAIADLFIGLKIANLRIPREGDRLKGFGYIDFEDRDDLINALKMTDPVVGGRRIRIDVSTTNNDGRMGRGRSDRDRDYDPERTMGDWRSGPRAQPEGSSRPQRDGMRDRDGPDRGPMTREGMQERGPMTREGMQERGPMTREGMQERGPMTREGMPERGPMTREGMRERDSSADNRPGGWREGERAAAEPARAPYGGRDSFGRDRERDERHGQRERGYGGRDGFRTAERDGERGGGGFGARDRGSGFGGRGFGDRDRERDPPPREADKPRERPKLNLLPRTLPREEEAEAPAAPAAAEAADQAKAVPKEKVFGAAKPVDTAAKEREIEERLRKQEEEARRGTDEKERWGRKNDHSGDRRGAPRRDDKTRDSRSYNRDRRDYSRDKDRRPAERRDYSPDRRRDYTPERRRDSRDRRRDSPERRRDSPVRRRGSSDRRRDSPDRRRDSPERRRDSSDRRRDSPDRRRDSPDRRRDSPDRRRDSPDRRRDSPDRRRDSPDRRRDSPERRKDYSPERKDERNGRDERGSRSRDRRDEAERPLPKMKEVEKPNFVGSNKFSFLEDTVDDASD